MDTVKNFDIIIRMMDIAPGSNREQGPTRDLSELDFYQRLGVSRNVTSDQLKQAYRRAIKNAAVADVENGSMATGDQKNSKLVNEAYLCLNNSRSRITYDRQFGGSSSQPPQNANFDAEFMDRDKEIEAKYAIHNSLRGLQGGVKAFIKVRDELVQRGIFTEEVINSMSEVRMAALYYIQKGLKRRINLFGKSTIDQWVKIGVITQEELDEIVKAFKQAKK